MRPQNDSLSQPEENFWLLRYRGPIFFFLIVLSVAGMYLAQKVPILFS